MPAFLLNAPSAGQQRLYLDESGTLGYGGEIFTMAMVLVRDLPKLEACTLKNRTTQSEVKASQMKTAQKLALARTLLDENDIEIYLAKLDPLAAMVSERKLDKELLYDSMVAQALAFYLERGDLVRGLPYRISMDMRGGLRESYEDMVAESVGNVLMHRPDPLVSSLDARFLDSKYSAGVQAADLFSNIYRTALTQTDSPCRSFLHKYQTEGLVHTGFTFGLVELADQMSQIAADLRARVELERAATPAPDDDLAVVVTVEETLVVEDASDEPASSGISRSARRRRSRAARRDRENALEKTAHEEAPLEGAPAMRESEAAVEAREANEAEKTTTARESNSHEAVSAARKDRRREAAAMPREAAPVVSKATSADAEEIAHAGEPSSSASEPESIPATASAQPAAPKPAAPARPVLPFAPEGRRTRRRPTRASSTVRETAASASAETTPIPETPEAAAPAKPDVRPGRAVRSRQAAQVASRERRRSRAATEPESPAVEVQQATAPAAEPSAPQAKPASKGKPAAKAPRDAAANGEVPTQPAFPMPTPVDGTAAAEVAPQTSHEADTSNTPEAPKPAPRKRSSSRKRKTTPAASTKAAPENSEAPLAVAASTASATIENTAPAHTGETPAVEPAPSVAEAAPEAPKPAPRKRSSSRRRKTAENPATDNPAPNAAPAPSATSEPSAS